MAAALGNRAWDMARRAWDIGPGTWTLGVWDVGRGTTALATYSGRIAHAGSSLSCSRPRHPRESTGGRVRCRFFVTGAPPPSDDGDGKRLERSRTGARSRSPGVVGRVVDSPPPLRLPCVARAGRTLAGPKDSRARIWAARRSCSGGRSPAREQPSPHARHRRGRDAGPSESAPVHHHSPWRRRTSPQPTPSDQSPLSYPAPRSSRHLPA